MSDEIRAERLWQTAKALVRSGSGWKAKEVLRTLFIAFPGHAAARAELSSILFADGEIDGALVHAAFAYRINPDISGLARRLGELYLLTSFYREALACLEHAVALGDNDAEVQEKISLCKEVLDAASMASSSETH